MKTCTEEIESGVSVQHIQVCIDRVNQRFKAMTPDVYGNDPLKNDLRCAFQQTIFSPEAPGDAPREAFDLLRDYSSLTLKHEFDSAAHDREAVLGCLAHAFRSPVVKSVSVIQIYLDLLIRASEDPVLHAHQKALTENMMENIPNLIGRLEDIVHNLELFTGAMAPGEGSGLAETIAGIREDDLPALRECIVPDNKDHYQGRDYAQGAEHLYPVPGQSWRRITDAQP
jgi:hypothetical protein